MALVATTLNGAITLNARQMRLTAFTNPSTGTMSAPTLALVDGEFMMITDATLTPTVAVTRGDQGTKAGAHNTLAPVIYGLSSDFTQTNGVAGLPVYSYGVDATITNPTVNAVIYIDKATAWAGTLTDPATDQQNTVMFVSRTAAAHLITYATGFYDNTTTSDVATFPATAGAVFTIIAQGGKWRPVATADDGVTIA
jgi:hypothetical protein